MRKLYLTRGDDTTIVVTISEAYDSAGNPISSLDGLIARFQARRSKDDPTPIISKSSSLGEISIQGMTLRIQLSHADTSSLQDGDVLVTDVELQDSAGRRTTIEIDGHPTILLHIRGDVSRV